MKQVVCIAIALALLFAGCAAPAAEKTASASAAEADESDAVVFADAALEAGVPAAMGKPEGGITSAEAEAVTRMDLSSVWPQDVSETEPIRDLGGLEYFHNLESLNLSANAVTDISPLAELSKLTLLSLGDNPVTDLSPLSGMAGLRGLILSGCQAADYSALSSLVNLEFLMLDRSTISDLSPLAALTGLKRLYLADCPIATYSPLADIYPNLVEKDFTVASTLSELGFTRPDNGAVAEYLAEGLNITINHDEWGMPGMEDQHNAVKMNLQMDNGYGLAIIYYPEINTYVFQMSINNEMILNYIYEEATGGFSLNASDRESAELVIKDALGETDADDILLAPIPGFNNTISETFAMTADPLFARPFEQAEALPSEHTTAPYALPYEPLGFTADTANASCIYEKHEPHYIRIAIHRPEWGENPDGFNIMFHDADVNGYNLVIMYFAEEGRYNVRLDKDGVDCSFDYYTASDQFGWEHPDIATVIQMFGDAFDAEGKETYHKPIPYFEQVVQESIGMSIEELYALPAGE
jgi:hypothetical protein